MPLLEGLSRHSPWMLALNKIGKAGCLSSLVRKMSLAASPRFKKFRHGVSEIATTTI